MVERKYETYGYNKEGSYFQVYKQLEKKGRAVSLKTYRAILDDFAKYMCDVLVEEGVINLPERLGVLRIVGKKKIPKIKDGKVSNMLIDWNGTFKLWKEDDEARENKQFIYFFNEHTNGVFYSARWYNRTVPLKNKFYYRFKMVPTLRKKLYNAIMNGKKYIIVNG